MKKLNITKKEYDESKYFTKKYGTLKYMSESGKVYKTDKGVILALEGNECPGCKETENESLGDIADAVKKTGGEMVDKVKDGAKKVGKAIGDKMHGIYRKNDRVKISGKAGDMEGAVVSADPDKVVIKPDNERSFDESDDESAAAEVTRGELTDMLQDVVDAVEKVCDDQDLSFEEVVGVEPKDEAEELDADEVVATKDEVAEVLADVIKKVEDVAEKADIELPTEGDEDEKEVADESLGDIADAVKKTGGEMVDKVKKGVKKAATKVGDMVHGIYRKGDRVTIAGKAGDVEGKVVSADPDKVVIEPDNERSFDECGDGKCECTKKEALESVRAKRAKIIREAIARRARLRKIRESIRARRVAKKVMESRKSARKAK